MNLGAFFLIVKLKTSRRFGTSSTVDTWFSFYWSSPNGALPSTPHSAHLKLSILDQLSQLRGATVQVWYCDHLWWWCLTDDEEDRCYCCWGFSFNLLDHVQRLSSAEAHIMHTKGPSFITDDWQPSDLMIIDLNSFTSSKMETELYLNMIRWDGSVPAPALAPAASCIVRRREVKKPPPIDWHERWRDIYSEV